MLEKDESSDSSHASATEHLFSINKTLDMSSLFLLGINQRRVQWRRLETYGMIAPPIGQPAEMPWNMPIFTTHWANRISIAGKGCARLFTADTFKYIICLVLSVPWMWCCTASLELKTVIPLCLWPTHWVCLHLDLLLNKLKIWDINWKFLTCELQENICSVAEK